MHIQEYLVRVAEEISRRPLPKFSNPSGFQKWRRQRQAEFHRILGIDRFLAGERTPLNIKRTGALRREGFRIEKLCFESLPGLYVTANLYVPEGRTGRMPGAIYVCGHTETQKIHYQ